MSVSFVKPKNLKIIRADLGVFDHPIILTCGSREGAQVFARWKYDDSQITLPESARGLCISKPGYVPIVWIPRYPRTPREHATLAHECTHAAWHVLEWADIPIVRDTQEVLLHTAAFLYSTALTELK